MPKQRKVMMPRGAIQQKAEWSGTRGSYLTHIPNLTRDTLEEIEVTPIREPISYSRVVYDHDRSEYIYEVWEPQLNAEEKEFLDMIKDSLNRTLEYEWDKMAEKDKKEYLQEAVDSFIKSRGLRLAPASKDKIVYYIIRDFVGYGPVDVLMADPRIEDVSCDGTGIPLFIFHQKFESIKTNVVFDDDDGLNSFAVMLGQRCAKQISVANPILDGTSVEGHRVQATYSHEVTTRGSSFTIRRYKEKPFTPVELVKFGTASAEMVAYLWVAVENGKSMMVCGGTASGKTATLNSAALFIRPGAKIVSIEDTREINLPHENWIPGTTRSGVGERGPDGKAGGEIDMYDLVRAALRQRPNYIVVGEVRGKETYTMFQAMATGHPTMSTMHADSVKSMVNRLENPPINTPRILLTALNFVIIQTHARIGDSIVRRIKQIVELVGFEPETNELITNTVYEWDAATDTFVYKGHSFLFDEIMEMKNMTHEEIEAEFQRRIDIVNYMLQKSLTDFREIAKIVVQYYQYPEETAKRIRDEMGWQAHAVMKPVDTGGETVG
ncbi:MAG: secretion system protein E [Methanobacteriota archaeon]|nr:MAG: secretion system protein E [Euryarchaeota archaeon]